MAQPMELSEEEVKEILTQAFKDENMEIIDSIVSFVAKSQAMHRVLKNRNSSEISVIEAGKKKVSFYEDSEEEEEEEVPQKNVLKIKTSLMRKWAPEPEKEEEEVPQKDVVKIEVAFEPEKEEEEEEEVPKTDVVKIKMASESEKENKDKKQSSSIELFCEGCKTTFVRGDGSYSRHVELGCKPFQCGMCPSRFKKRHAMKAHEEAVHSKAVIPCLYPSCNSIFNSVKKLKAHSKRTHGQSSHLLKSVNFHTPGSSSSSSNDSAEPAYKRTRVNFEGLAEDN